MTASDLQWYSDLKAELGGYGIQVDDISRLAKAVRGIREQDYDVNRVVTEFSNLEVLAVKKNNLQRYVWTLEARLAILNQQCSESELKLNFHNEAISKYTQLESIGFGLKELTLLWNIVNEIAEANDIPLERVTSKFVTDIEEQYDRKSWIWDKVREIADGSQQGKPGFDQVPYRIVNTTTGRSCTSKANSEWLKGAGYN